MTFPTYVGAGAVASGAGSATINPALPTGHAVDDINIVVVETADLDVATPPSGWTLMPSNPIEFDTATFTQFQAWWRREQSGDAAPSIVGPTNHIIGVTIGIRGCPTVGDPWDDFVIGTFASSGSPQWTSESHTTAPGPHLQTNDADELIMLLTTAEDDTNTALYTNIANTSLASVTERVDATINTGNGGNLFIASGELATPGDTGVWTATKALPRGAGCYMVIGFSTQAVEEEEYGWGIHLTG